MYGLYDGGAYKQQLTAEVILLYYLVSFFAVFVFAENIRAAKASKHPVHGINGQRHDA